MPAFTRPMNIVDRQKRTNYHMYSEENTREQDNKYKREMLIRSFFNGVELEGNPITSIRFEAIKQMHTKTKNMRVTS